MGKILSIDDFQLYAEMVGELLRQRGGHTVKVMINPLVVDEIEAFCPDLVVVNLVRKPETISAGGLKDFYTEVDGAKAFRALAPLCQVRGWPVVVTSLAVAERDVPQDLRYESFVEVPQRLDYLLHSIDRILTARAHHTRNLPEG
jgi:CheY-like chemotaxis protein